MEALDVIEKRIDTLSRMLGPVMDGTGLSGGNYENSKTENVIDSLLSANTLLNEATKDREQINKCVRRASELEKYLDPDFIEENQQVRSKEVYINAVAPELYMQCEQLLRIKQLEPTLGAEYFRNIPIDDLNKLKEISSDNVEFSLQSELIEESLILAMKRYGEIQTDLLKSLDAMNQRLEVIEQKIQHKKREDLDEDLPIEDQ